ncbi:MAG: HlyD family efflux transporter periplasmic adaptor subunit, partial [Chitinophagaceae bacterium]
PNDLRAEFRLGFSYLQLRQTKKALPVLQDVNHKTKEFNPELQLLLGQGYHLDYKFDSAVVYYQEFRKSENEYNYYMEKQGLSKRILQADSVSTKQQLVQDRQSYDAAQNALGLMQKKVGDLIVRAPVDGQLTSLDAEIGQSKNKGERLGQLDVIGGFKVRADIDEHYISRIYTGLSATVPLGGKEYKLKITKVYTQITGGRFQVDMEFDGEVPAGIRRGQTLQIVLALSEERKALLLAKGGFYQTTGGNWVFKVREDGSSAYRVNNVQLGNQNRDYYEVVGGLQPGDKIITSSYENYGTMEELILKK